MNILTIPPTKNPGQKSLDVSDAYLARIVPSWYTPPTFNADIWRKVVQAQEIAVICKETLISSVLSLDWKITAVDSNYQDELAGTIKYYTKLLTSSGGIDYADHVEWIASDLLDTPFGGMSELGRDGDKPEARVRWIEPLDAATLYPTLNKDFPIIQYFNGDQVAFPLHAVARVGMTPRTKLEYKGWYIAPPEKIYMAMQMLSRGDNYYANLLLDIPTTGLLDLGDMEKSSALEWVEAYKGLLANGGNTAFKIPVLYEHEGDVKFIPFGKVPNDIMFDRITLRYAAITCAGYGMTLSDIGIQVASNGGETLAGSIRSERKTRKNGQAKLKAKLKGYFQQILPKELQFTWIDYDDEVNMALGRARLANASAFSIWRKDGVLSSTEERRQLLADGMFTISMPETPPPDAKPESIPVGRTPTNNPIKQEKPNMIGNPKVAPSMGGHGENMKSTVAKILELAYVPLLEIREISNLDNLPVLRGTVTETINNGDMDELLHGVKVPEWLVFEGDVSEDLKDKYDMALKKTILLSLKDVILSDDGIDFSNAGVYDSILETITNHLGTQFESILQGELNEI